MKAGENIGSEKGHRRLDWAFAQQDCDSTSKLLLICMAKVGNGRGTCYMRVSRLAEMMCASVKTVHRAIRRLQSAGLIFEVRPKGVIRRRTKTYSFACDGVPGPREQVVPSLRDKSSLGRGQNDRQNLKNHKEGIGRASRAAYREGGKGRSIATPIGAILERRLPTLMSDLDIDL